MFENKELIYGHGFPTYRKIQVKYSLLRKGIDFKVRGATDRPTLFILLYYIIATCISRLKTF